jgi:hypothetical protein
MAKVCDCGRVLSILREGAFAAGSGKFQPGGGNKEDGAEGGPRKFTSLLRSYSAILKSLNFSCPVSFLTWPTELTSASPLGTKWTTNKLLTAEAFSLKMWL